MNSLQLGEDDTYENEEEILEEREENT